ncbi:polynucleotide kinase 3 phosphatase-domain-containing protein [Nemania abortiva]|nr:polynucleotide kinase 3 phosphatase-domain-containing protein [Nemania abortiva]
MISWTFNDSGLLIGVFSPHDKRQSIVETDQSIKIAAFDLDGTIIKPKSGGIRPRDSDDWEWWDLKVPSKIQEAYGKGFAIKIITNQGRLTNLDGSQAPEAVMFKHMIQQLLEILDVPVSIYVACADDNWRKPREGVWQFLIQEYQRKGKQIDHSQSFYVGDSAGRADDHADTDIHYSMNLGIGFRTPEAFFLDSRSEATGHKFNPSWFLRDQNSWDDLALRIKRTPIPVILLVGGPGAGKSYFFRKILQPLGYSHICPRTLGSQKRCEEDFENAILTKRLVVIDGNNRTINARTSWLSIAGRCEVQVTAIFFDLQATLCLHNDTVRALGGDVMNPERRGIFPRTSFLKAMAEFEKPSPSEDFTEVIHLSFQWIGSDEELQIWQKFWV